MLQRSENRQKVEELGSSGRFTIEGGELTREFVSFAKKGTANVPGSEILDIRSTRLRLQIWVDGSPYSISLRTRSVVHALFLAAAICEALEEGKISSRDLVAGSIVVGFLRDIFFDVLTNLKNIDQDLEWSALYLNGVELFGLGRRPELIDEIEASTKDTQSSAKAAESIAAKPWARIPGLEIEVDSLTAASLRRDGSDVRVMFMDRSKVGHRTYSARLRERSSKAHARISAALRFAGIALHLRSVMEPHAKSAAIVDQSDVHAAQKAIARYEALYLITYRPDRPSFLGNR